MTKATRLIWFFSAVIFLITAFNGSASSENIKVGVVLPLTGKLAEFGKIEQRSFLMAANEINAAGGAKGERIDLIIKDTMGKPEVGRSVMERLISQYRVIVVGGGYSSSVTHAAAAVARGYQVPFLVNTASADKLTELGWENVFRLNPPVSEHPKALASFITKVAPVTTTAILHENSLGQFEVKKFSRLCKKLGLKVVMKESYAPGTDEFRPLLFKVKTKRPDLVYMVSNVTDASRLISQAKEVNLSPRLFVGRTAGFTLPEFQNAAGDASEYVCSATLWAPSVPYPGARNYYDKYFARYKSAPGYHGAEAYAAMYVIADALERAKSPTPKDVRDALAETDMMTVFGPVKFVSYGKKIQQNRLPTLLVQWIDGRLETVWPKEVASRRYVYPLPKRTQ